MKSTIKNILLATALISGSSVAYSLPLSHYTTSSRFSQGKWVKIKVSRTGMQSVSFDQLRQWGFENPENVSVYGYGGAELFNHHEFTDDLPDDVAQTASMIHGDRLIFYGESTTRLNPMTYNSLEYINNVYDTGGYYFLSDSEDRRPLTYKAYNESYNANTLRDTHYNVQIFQPDDNNKMNGGAYWLGPTLNTADAYDVSFHIKGFKTNNGLVEFGTMGYVFVAANQNQSTTLEVTQPSNVSMLYINDRNTVGIGNESTFFNTSNGSSRYRPYTTGALEDANIKFSFKLPADSKASYAALKQVWTIYPRRNDMYGEQQMAMTFNSTNDRQNFSISSPQKVEVWNISNPLDIYAYDTRFSSSSNTTIGTFDKKYTSGLSCGRMIAFNPEVDLLQPEFCETVDNQNIHGDSTPEMVIIATDELYEVACQLADIHRSQGHEVNVYTHRQVLNEFGSGTAAPMAYRMMAKMFYDRDPQKFKYMLLYGGTTWDFRGIYTPVNEALLTFLADRESHYKEMSSNFSNDSYFGMLDDDYDHSKMEYANHTVAVGRLNVPNPGMGNDVNEKIRRYMESPEAPATYARILAMTCRGDANAHYFQGEQVADDAILSNPAFSATRAHVSLYPLEGSHSVLGRNKATEAMNMGVGFFDYSGHGDASNLGTGNGLIWTLSSISQLRNTVLPVAMLSTCSAYSLDYTNNDMAAALVFNADGGAIAAIGACRKVYLVYNGIFNSALAKTYAEATPGTTIGQLYTKARMLAISNGNNSQSALANNLCYNLLGDPMVTLPIPDYTASISSIADKTPAEDEAVAVAPGNTFTITGSITDSEGKVISDFNGSIRAIVYDGPKERKQVVTDGAPADTATLEEDILAEIGARVVNGQYTINMCLPTPSVTGKRNRIVLSAVTDQGKHRSALGYTNDFVLDEAATNGSSPEAKAPAILEVWLNDKSFKNGSELTTTDNRFYALVDAHGLGISNSTAMVGAQPRLTLDNHQDLAGIGSNYSIDKDGNYLYSMPISDDIPAGMHSLKFSLTNGLGQYASRSVNFVLTPKQYNVSVTVAEPTATTGATIEMDTDHECDNVRLLILDHSGNTVFSATKVKFPYQWNLKDIQGNKVADGQYRAIAKISDKQGHGASDPCRFTVIKK